MNIEERKAYNKKYYKEHKEEIIISNQEWSKRNPEKAKIYFKKNYQKNKGRKLVSVLKWRKAHPEKVKMWAKNNYEKNKEAYYARSKNWHETHPEYVKNYYQKIKKQVLTYYGNGELNCVFCHDTRIYTLTIDHINSGGKQHRKIIHPKNIYNWLKKNKFPSGFRTICGSCQLLVEAMKRGEEVEIWNWRKDVELPA